MKRLAQLSLVLLVLTGCSVLRPAPGPSEDWQAREDRLLGVSGWQLRGRIAVRYQERGGQANLNWQQTADESLIRLSGPFGAGAYQIVWEPEVVTVTGKQGVEQLLYTGPDAAEQFLLDQLGWSFPAASTRYWLLGLLDPQYKGRAIFDDEGRLAGLEQNGWIVTYERFVEVADLLLPGKLVMEKSDSRLRLAIHAWNLEPVT